MTDEVLALEMRNITKTFPGVVANDNVTFTVRKGEVHALLGENGAGKSTLMNVLCGLYHPELGSMAIHNQPVVFHSPRDAIEAGVGMVHQHFMLVDSMTVAENIILGLRNVSLVLKTSEIEKEIRRIGEQYGLPVHPGLKVWQLSVGEQQRVEIIKQLYRGVDILILDEPTAVLTPQETETLFETLRQMTAAGKTIIFISHKLDEVLSIANRVTVLRGGKWIATVDAEGMTKPELASLMVGREVLFQIKKAPAAIREERLVISDLEALNDKGLLALNKLSLSVRSGEIVGIAGVAGNGQKELAETICGLRTIERGSIMVADNSVAGAPPILVIEAGVAYIPEDRSATGSAPHLSVAENLALKSYRRPGIGRGAFINRKKMREEAVRLIREFDISTPDADTQARLLSGGNLQKLILAREISQQPQVTIAASPTRGLDVGATENVRNILLQERTQGAAILLISEDLDEVMALSDRIAVIYEGEIVGLIPGEQADREEIGLMMAGESVERHATQETDAA